jgi:hypothetical protein
MWEVVREAFACRDKLNRAISQPISAPGFELGTFWLGSRMLPSIRPLFIILTGVRIADVKGAVSLTRRAVEL